MFNDRLNLVTERLIKAGNWRGTKNRVTFNVFPDANNHAFITLPRMFNTVLAGAVIQQCSSGTALWGLPLNVRNGWYSYSQTGTGLVLDARYRWGEGFVPEEGRFTTFADWKTPMYLRIVSSTADAEALNIRGTLNGLPIYTGSTEGISMTLNGTTPVTSSQQFDAPPYEIAKPTTSGRISLYTWDGTTQTLVAIYDPEETNPAWRRYKVPACSTWTAADPGQFVAICKREWGAISNANDEVIPGNIGAIRFGLEALNVEDARSDIEAEGMWEKAMQLLANESADDDGDGVVQSVEVSDDFRMLYVGGMT